MDKASFSWSSWRDFRLCSAHYLQRPRADGIPVGVRYPPAATRRSRWDTRRISTRLLSARPAGTGWADDSGDGRTYSRDRSAVPGHRAAVLTRLLSDHESVSRRDDRSRSARTGPRSGASACRDRRLRDGADISRHAGPAEGRDPLWQTSIRRSCAGGGVPADDSLFLHPDTVTVLVRPSDLGVHRSWPDRLPARAPADRSHLDIDRDGDIAQLRCADHWAPARAHPHGVFGLL